MTLHYKVVRQHSDEGYSVSCPALPGCWSQGDTEEEALDNIKEAIREYFEVLLKKQKVMKMKYVFTFLIALLLSQVVSAQSLDRWRGLVIDESTPEQAVEISVKRNQTSRMIAGI